MSTAMSACAKSFESETCRERSILSVPCHVGDPDLWFAENPLDLERAKALCADCPIRRECLSAALERQEPWGVWGGEIIERGTVIARKRPRGRPRKNTTEVAHARSTEGVAHARSTEGVAHARSTEGVAHARSTDGRSPAAA